MGRSLNLLTALSTITFLAFGAGCIGQPADEATPAGSGTDGAAANLTHTHALNFTGDLTVSNPTTPDPTGLGVLPNAGQSGMSYNDHVVTLNATAKSFKLTLAWSAQATPAAAVPDLDVFVYAPDGSDISQNAGATAVQPEVVEIAGPLEAGDYTIRVNLFAGAPTSYTLDVEITEEAHAATPAAA